MSKTIMIMSASPDGRLLTAVAVAKKLGIRTVACVREEDDISDVDADRVYAVDGHRTDKLLEIARDEDIDGVLGVYDKTALSAAIIAEELGLCGNSPDCIRSLMEKSRFRQLQREAGVFGPNYFETDTVEGLEERCSRLHFPIIIKPVLCSSSFGQTVLYDDRDIIPSFKKAAGHSGNDAVCVEEFIEHDSPLKVLEAEIFLVGDDILWDGLYWCYRFPEAPLRPVLTTYPAELTGSQRQEFEFSVKTMLVAAGASMGEFDIEGFFTEEGRFFIIEINPRPAGYYCQQDVEMFCGVDFTKLLVTTALGDMSYYEELKHFKRKRNYILSYAIFSFSAGIMDHVYIDPSIREELLKLRVFPGGEAGDQLEDIHADNRPVGMAIFGFASEERLKWVQANIRELVYVILRNGPTQTI